MKSSGGAASEFPALGTRDGGCARGEPSPSERKVGAVAPPHPTDDDASAVLKATMVLKSRVRNVRSPAGTLTQCFRDDERSPDHGLGTVPQPTDEQAWYCGPHCAAAQAVHDELAADPAH